MKKHSSISLAVATLAIPLALGGCEKKACLEQGYEATLQVVRDFNQGRCRAVLDGDQRIFDCPSGLLGGEVNGSVFELGLESLRVQYQMGQGGLMAQCGPFEITIIEEEAVHKIQDRLKLALSDLEVD